MLNLQTKHPLYLDSETPSIHDLPEQSFDLISFYLDVDQMQPLEQTFAALKHTLKIQGILLFACTGIEMHALGDALLKAGFADPVTDRENFEEEVIFAYAWRKPQSSYQLENGDIAIPLSQISTRTSS